MNEENHNPDNQHRAPSEADREAFGVKDDAPAPELLFELIREGGIGLQPVEHRDGWFTLCGNSAAEVFNPRRLAPPGASKNITFRPTSTYRVHVGYRVSDPTQILAYQPTLKAITAAGISIIRMDVDKNGELVFFIQTQAEWSLDPTMAMFELRLPTFAARRGDQTVVDSTAAPAISSMVDPEADARAANPNDPVAAHVAPPGAKPVTQEDINRWLDTKASTKEVATPVRQPPRPLPNTNVRITGVPTRQG